MRTIQCTHPTALGTDLPSSGRVGGIEKISAKRVDGRGEMRLRRIVHPVAAGLSRGPLIQREELRLVRRRRPDVQG
jgi:hypothetical protein